MMTHWFILGNFPILSAAEVLAVLSLSEQTSKWQLETPILKVRENFEAKKIIKQIGGTIKIGQELKSKLTEKQMLETAIAELLEKTGKIHFGLSVYGNIDLNKIKNWAKEIKKEMTAVGRSVRFVFKNESVLSSVTVDKNNLIEKGAEFLIIKNTDNLYSIAKTLTVQPFEELGRRDFGRPGRNSRSGMLPPKLAMMLINLSNMSANKTLLDPFCGSGTIVTEALLMDYKKIIGSDISNQAIIDTHKNIAWLKPNNETKIFVADVNDLTKHIKPASVDTIVTEPYLGQPLRGNEVKQILEKQTDELKKIYLSAFEIFKKILKQNGTIIFIIPRFKFRNEWIKIDCQKEIEKIGFSTESLIKFKNEKYFSLLYWRDNQHLGREIWKFKKN
ncbi:MAG: hypothetical protein COU29_02285 [Candidatus Magasanikbacteria bacterium CG10_big_fil_rev_8_21_14_0_10_36_32]|uniref:Ribosomal RNA large subunit methyltransferase K/L-like methyltransferase domain-containing protein n=1 Tax=Candidatus Magasanikbacteria bacterium CG10_big_fil_rev_8_21_14_0_10_36_32 TaxID=1974646 RepID=A0A2M6W738_9BACT|nr:MAG: hypothetical protein COU29_02285 [Candidatus Magasanikbacteria bacterium CG10_big_fil_rev_8_21_14_0_10_36_32]